MFHFHNHKCDGWLNTVCLSSLQFSFKEIVLTEEEKRLLSKEGATIPTHMPLTKVLHAEKCLFTWADGLVLILRSIVSLSLCDRFWPMSWYNSYFRVFFALKPFDFASWIFKWVFGAFIYTLSSVMSTSWLTPPLCLTGRRADVEEDQEENPQQAVCSGEPQEEEGVCWWTGKQVRWRGQHFCKWEMNSLH